MKAIAPIGAARDAERQREFLIGFSPGEMAVREAQTKAAGDAGCYANR